MLWEYLEQMIFGKDKDMLKTIFTARDIDYYERSKNFKGKKLQMSNIQSL
jgi:hypothetical protein